MRVKLRFSPAAVALHLIYPACALALLLVASFVHAQTNARKVDADVWYLLVRRAGTPQKNYYELTRAAHFVNLPFSSEQELQQYKPSPRNPGFDIITDLTVRYGVYQAWKIRVARLTDSQKAPASLKDAVYVLVYKRNPDWRFAAKKYKVDRTASGGQNFMYTDFQDGREDTMELSPDWPRRWTIYEVEILDANAFMEIAQNKGPVSLPRQ